MKEKKRHESLERLLSAVEVAGVVGPSALASALNESDQTLTNWGSRGVSALGAINAQNKFGCNAYWVINGTGAKTVLAANGSTTALKVAQETAQPARPTLEQTIERLSEFLSEADKPTRKRAIDQLSYLVDAPQDHEQVAAMMQAAFKTKQSKAA